jgi:serine/threonine protein kinase
LHLKPLRNFDGDYSLKIADFGLAMVLEGGQKEKQRCGSPGYVAPEVLNNLGYDTKADIFSAGVILYILYLDC